MLVIKYRFTCGDWHLNEIIKKYKNIITRTVWKLSSALFSSNDDSTFWKKYQFWLKNVSSFRKQQIGQVESFLNSKLWLKRMIQNSPNTKNMEFVTCNGTVSLHIYLTIREMLWNCRKLSKKFFDRYRQCLIYWRRTGSLASSPPTFDIFLILANFEDPNCLVAGQLVRWLPKNYRKYPKIQVWKRLGQVSSKILFPQTILTKVFDPS